MFRVEIVLEFLMDDIDYIKRNMIIDRAFKKKK